MAIDIDNLNRLHAATTQGNRTVEGHAWVAGVALDVDGNPPLIAWNQHAGNWVNEPLWGRIGQFDKAEDRDFALAIHSAWPEIAAEIARLRTENERLKAEIASINEHGLPLAPHDLSDLQ